MNKRTNTYRWVAGVLAVWLLISACGLLRTATVGDDKSETQTVELGDADTAKVRINMGAGELTVVGEAKSLMDAEFRYNVDDWRPRVSYKVNGSQGDLVVEHEKQNITIPIGNTVKNDWILHFSNSVPIDMAIQTGAGNSELDLHALNLTGLHIDVGAGNMTVDLSGALDHDLKAIISGGVGELTVKFPSGMGVRVSADTAIGGLTNSGLVRDGDFYVNETYGSAANTLYLEISAGVGSINLLAP